MAHHARAAATPLDPRAVVEAGVGELVKTVVSEIRLDRRHQASRARELSLEDGATGHDPFRREKDGCVQQWALLTFVWRRLPPGRISEPPHHAVQPVVLVYMANAGVVYVTGDDAPDPGTVSLP